MIISVNWLKQYTDITMPIDELATLIGARLVEIEEVDDISDKYKGILIAKVVSCVELEGSDHLNIVKLDDSGVAKDIERDSDGYVQVVCGAPNIREGLTVVWLPPGVTVPESWKEKEPFVLGARNLRGAMSNGMIASAKELDLYDDHAGIVELQGDFQPGDSFAEKCALDDILLDIENKSLTHRPDTFGVIGFAREVAAIQGKAFVTPEWLAVSHERDQPTDGEVPQVAIDDTVLSSRYQAVIIKGIDGARQSTIDRQAWLGRVGVRPISAVVDITNYLMMLTGQPLHAFDYNKLLAVNNGVLDIHVRTGQGEGDTLILLDGREITLSPEDIVIANGETPVALAGAMGGKATEVDEHTTAILLESASFNLYNLRATQMRHGIFSEAITRFTKGQPAELTSPVLYKAIELYQEIGATVASTIADAYPVCLDETVINLETTQVRDILGSDMSDENIIELLRRVECRVVIQNEGFLSVTIPYWRSDLHIIQDLIEEIGRIDGFDNITPTLPIRSFEAVRPTAFDTVKQTLRRILVRAGANEVLTYSFVHGDVLKKSHQDPENSYRITNSISPDLQYYRQSLTPSLLGLVHPNIKSGFGDIGLFEINKTHNKIHGLDDEKVPGELPMLAFVFAKKQADSGAPYYAAKEYLECVANSLGCEFVYESIDKDPGYPVTAPFEWRRSALVSDKHSGEFLGIIGEYKRSVAKSFKLPEYSAGFEVSTQLIAQAVAKQELSYRAMSKYPSVERDICFQIDKKTTYQELIENIQGALPAGAITTSISPIDIYGRQDEATKNITIRLQFVSDSETLTGEKVATYMENITRTVQDVLQATVI